MRGLFVTGTGTGVGKTVVAAALLHRYRSAVPLRYWKPIQTGIEQDDDTKEVVRLARCEPSEVRDEGIRLPRPVSPHLAARLSGMTIDVGALLQRVTSAGGGRTWIIEGAGGVLVPITDTVLMIDLIARLGVPALIAASSTLGTINHTLLTIEALRTRGLTIAGVVMVGPPDAANREAIERYGGVAVVGQMPRFEPLTPDALAAWARISLDPDGMLQPHLGVDR